MARGSSYGEQQPLPPISVTPQTSIPRRATRILPQVHVEEDEAETYIDTEPIGRYAMTPEPKTVALSPASLYADYSPLARHRSWLTALILCMVCVVVVLAVIISAGIFQRTPDPHVVAYNGQTFSIQVGGSVTALNTWQNSTGPIPSQTPIPSQLGPYSVLGKPTITGDFINQVLASYNSPAAGLGQAMHDLGVKYGIDPVYALAFFMHESLFGTTGEARVTFSLGNLRCISSRPCIDQNRGGYAQMYNWVDGFEQWYKLIRNLYVAQWGRVTVDQIIPKYAPNSDGNNEAGYIASLKHEIDAWHAGIIRP
jgi:hypothetical protein